MKNTHLKYRNIPGLGLLVLLLAVLSSCSKMDDYKEFTKGGEITYTGKLDSVQVLSGKYKVLVKGLFIADPKVKKTVIYWKNMTDSIVVPVARTPNVDTLSVYINNLVEGVHNFVIYTYDAAGNRSIPVYKTGVAYGDRYQATLSDRGLSVIMDATGLTTVAWSGMDRLSGVFATDIRFTDNGNVERTLRVPIDVNSTILTGYKLNSPITYRTLFRPDTLSIDTFYTSYKPVESIYRDVTANYLVNSRAPFTQTEFNGRWGTPSGWTTNAAIKNWLAGGKYYGGVDRNQSSRLSLEAGWTNGNLLSFTNGKVFQSPTLTAGTYTLEVDVQGASSAGSFYIAAATGADLPNIDNINTSLANVRITSTGATTYNLNFVVTQESKVSLGIVGTLVGTSSNGQFLKINAVRLKFVQNI